MKQLAHGYRIPRKLRDLGFIVKSDSLESVSYEKSYFGPNRDMFVSVTPLVAGGYNLEISTFYRGWCRTCPYLDDVLAALAEFNLTEELS